MVQAIDDYASKIGFNFAGAYNPGSRKLENIFFNIEIVNTSKIDSKNYDLIAGTAWALSNSKHRENSEKEKKKFLSENKIHLLILVFFLRIYTNKQENQMN